MTDTAPEVPAPYDSAGLYDLRNRVQKSFRKVYRITQLWPWEWLPPHFNLRPEDWNINCSERLASVVDFVCKESSLPLDELRDFLVNLHEKGHQRLDKSAGPSARLSTACKLARKWFEKKQDYRRLARKSAETVQTPGTSRTTAGMRHDEDDNGSEAESGTDIRNVPKDLPSPEHDDQIHARRSFAPTEPEFHDETVLSLINQGPAPERQESIPRKRTRYSAGLDSIWGNGPEEIPNSQAVNAEAELSRIEAAYRISINRMIQDTENSIDNTAVVKKLCLEELEERQRAVNHIGAKEKDQAYRLAVESLKQAQDQLEEVESFMESMADRVAQRGCECPKPYRDAYNESIREVMRAVERRDCAKESLQTLEDETKDHREKHAEALERIESLVECIQEYDQIIAKDTKVQRALHAKLAALNILSCQNLDLVPTETLEMFRSSMSEVLGYVNGSMSEV